jgi:hypothetical protein
LKKNQTYEQVETAQARAVNFLRSVLGNNDRADEIEAMLPEAWAEEKGIVITNPNSERRNKDAANGRTGNAGNGDDMTKSDLQDCVDQAIEILETAYQPEASREDLACAVGDALAALNGDLDDEDEDDTDDDDDDGS